jgi:hypothetical protein
MTQDELDALPETGGIGQREEIIDGKRVVVPTMLSALCLYQNPDEPAFVIGNDGRRWMIGWADGVRYKTRLPN